MPKRKFILFIIFLIILLIILGVFAYFTYFKEETKPLNQTEEAAKGEFTLSAVVLSVDTGNKFLTVRPTAGGDSIKIVLSDTAKIEKLTIPYYDPKNPPQGGIVPEKSPAGINDFQKGSYIFIDDGNITLLVEGHGERTLA